MEAQNTQNQDGRFTLETFGVWSIYSMPTDKNHAGRHTSDYHWTEK